MRLVRFASAYSYYYFIEGNSRFVLQKYQNHLRLPDPVLTKLHRRLCGFFHFRKRFKEEKR